MTEWALRNYQESDLLALLELINLADRVDQAGYATTVEALAHRLADLGMPATDNVFVAESCDRLAGYVSLLLLQGVGHTRVVVHGIVHPDWRRKGIGTALVKRAQERARALKSDEPLFLDMFVREPVAGAAELATFLGLQPMRYFFYMECHDLQRLPEPVFPNGIRLRSYLVGQDEAAFVEADCDAFSDHWGYVPHTLEREMHRVAAPDFRSENNLLAVDREGRIAGLCLLMFPKTEGGIPHVNPPLIDDLAVRPAYRRRGIGRALLLGGMHRIRDEGFSSAALGVDADNPKALGLYESVGFVLKSRSTAYRKELCGELRVDEL